MMSMRKNCENFVKFDEKLRKICEIRLKIVKVD